jgi:hypothetical protein
LNLASRDARAEWPSMLEEEKRKVAD